jgi:PAS domain S-box-containing protein
MLTRTVSEEFAASIKRYADDYVLKDQPSVLPKAIDGALKHLRTEQEMSEALQSLVKSEENLKAIFDSASEAIILTDTEGIIKAFNNRAGENILHIKERVITLGQCVFDLIEDLREEYFAAIILKLWCGETVQYDKLHHTALGRVVWINYSFNPVKKGNVISGVCITGRDITSKKMAEQQREFDQNNLYALINNTRDMMWSVDRNFKLITSNHAFNEMVMIVSGVKLEKGTDVLKDIFDAERVTRAKARYERAFAGETFTDLEYTSSPFEIWLEQSFYPIYEGAAVIGTACFSRNITERKKAEDEIKVSTERMSAILNTVPANIALLDRMGLIVEVNDSWKKFAHLNGYTGPDYCKNGNYLAISGKAMGLGELDGITVAAGINNVLKNNMKQFVFEYACNAPGEKSWFRLIATQLWEKGYYGAVVMHIDVSEIRRLEEERLKSSLQEQKLITRAVLKAGDKERTRLGLELHDNITQLLAVIKMRLGFSLAHPEKNISIIEECKGYVQEALSEARNLSHKMVLPRFEEHGFNQSVEFLVQKYRSVKRDIHLEMGQMDEKILSAGIRETLYRIVQEQLNNIEKYARASKIIIEILTLPDHVTLILGDNGMGFDLNKKGNGIGITNIINRVESYNGWTKIITEPGKGCTLFVEIPVSS